jgi:hypothetical protein
LTFQIVVGGFTWQTRETRVWKLVGHMAQIIALMNGDHRLTLDGIPSRLRLTSLDTVTSPSTLMFKLYYFVDYKTDEGEPEPYMVAFDIVEGDARHIEAYVYEGSFLTLLDAQDRMNNRGSRWFFYPNACITEVVGDKEVLVGIYLQSGVNYELSPEEYEALKEEAVCC